MEQLGAASLEAVTKPPPDPTDLEGLCALLELHLATLAQAQEPLHSLHFPGQGLICMMHMQPMCMTSTLSWKWSCTRNDLMPGAVM